MIREVLVGDVLRLLAHAEWHATPALLGASAYAASWSADVRGPAVTWGCVVLVVVLRILAVSRDWQVPPPRVP